MGQKQQTKHLLGKQMAGMFPTLDRKNQRCRPDTWRLRLQQPQWKMYPGRTRNTVGQKWQTSRQLDKRTGRNSRWGSNYRRGRRYKQKEQLQPKHWNKYPECKVCTLYWIWLLLSTTKFLLGTAEGKWRPPCHRTFLVDKADKLMS